MAFNNYLEDENDKPYFTTNSLGYYYDKMEGFAEKVEQAAKILNVTKEEIEQRIALRLAEWDKNLESFDGSVEKLLTEWVDDGTLNHVIDSTLIDQKIAPVTAQFAETLKKSDTGVLSLNVFTEEERAKILGVEPGTINAVLGAGNVRPENTSFLKVKNANIFDKAKVSSGYIVSKTNGEIVAVAGYSASDYMLVKVGETYNTTRIYDTAYYDINKVFISGFGGGGVNNTIVIPSNAVYMRVSLKDEALNGAMVVNGELPSSYAPYGSYDIEITDNAFLQAIQRAALNSEGPTDPPPTGDGDWSGERVFMFGDSITYWDKKEAWFEAGYMIKGLGSYIEERLGATVYNFGVGGNTAKQVSDRVENANLSTVTDILTYAAGTNDAIDASVVLGTIDDLYTQDTFYGNVKRAVRHVYMQNPKIKMYFITPHRSNRPVKPFVDALVELGKFYGIPTFNAYEQVQVNEFTESTYLVDKVHFYNEGYELFADRLIPFLANN